MNDALTRKAAKEFAEYWKDKGYEKGESQKFWLSLLRDVCGVEEPEKFISFEDQVHLDNTSFIDGMIPATHVMIEQKENNARISEIQAILRDSIDQESDIRQFITEICQYAEITELDEGILNHLIDRIMIGDVKKVNGEKVQEVRIFYNFVGEVGKMAA